MTGRAMRFGQRGVPAAAADTPTAFESATAALALVALVGTGLFGTVSAGAFILAALILIAVRPLASGRALLRFSPLLILPVFAALSTFWSDAPERTLRAALQLLLTVFAAIIVCHRLSARASILTLFASYVVVALLAGPGAVSSLGSGLPLLGPFESKNQMGIAAQLLLALALAVVADRDQPGLARCAAVAAIPVSALLLLLSQSSGALVSVAVTVIAFTGFLLLGRTVMPLRLAIVALTLLLCGLALAFLPEIETAVADFRQNVLQKDATLTGRTYLWAYADALIADRPWLGHGYYAFWRHGNLDAEGLWRWGGIASRTGFNFHNAFVEMQVDLGRAGLAVFVATCVIVALLGSYRQITRPTVPMAFLATFVIVTYVRSFAESGLIAPFSLVTLLWVATAVHALAPAPAARAARTAAQRRPGRAGRDRQPRSPARA